MKTENDTIKQLSDVIMEICERCAEDAFILGAKRNEQMNEASEKRLRKAFVKQGFKPIAEEHFSLDVMAEIWKKKK